MPPWLYRTVLGLWFVAVQAAIMVQVLSFMFGVGRTWALWASIILACIGTQMFDRHEVKTNEANRVIRGQA